MDNLSLQEEWHRSFGNSLPIGFSCRELLSDRWLRIHSLPGAKRYASTDCERHEVLLRQRSVSNYVLGDQSECILFASIFDRGLKSEFIKIFPKDIDFNTYINNSDDHGDFEIIFSRIVWNAARYEELVVEIANDRACPVLFANVPAGSAYAPYDGGADLIFSSHFSLVKAREHFSLWLSERDDGL